MRVPMEEFPFRTHGARLLNGTGLRNHVFGGLGRLFPGIPDGREQLWLQCLLCPLNFLEPFWFHIIILLNVIQ